MIDIVKLILHLEGAFMLIFALYGYVYFEYNWWIFFVFLLVPDVAMLGYLVSQRFGAVLYNLGHVYVISLSLCLIGIAMGYDLFILIGLIWTAHIGMDRMFGFGLKYPTKFQDTHLDRV